LKLNEGSKGRVVVEVVVVVVVVVVAVFKECE